MRKTKHDYSEPASFARVLEACVEYRDADSEDDGSYRRSLERLRAAVNAYGRRKFERMKRIMARRTVRVDSRQVSLFGNVGQEACQVRSKVEEGA